jgi:phosphoribosylformylglycinamidine cyclo-ligase/phosphoribosylamine--glycine ligase/phosphoribosylformylglycinamidine cyclo-ligase
MPGVYQAGEFDVAGTIVGVVERADILPRKGLRAGDRVIGFKSSGPHTNGYSLIRQIFAGADLDPDLADALLAPHRSYFPILHPLLAEVKALAHITGGGLIENIPRVLPDGLDAVIRLEAWTPPPLWQLIQSRGNIDNTEMYRVFNMGIGMVAIVDQESAAALQDRIPEETCLIGELTFGKGVVKLI